MTDEATQDRDCGFINQSDIKLEEIDNMNMKDLFAKAENGVLSWEQFEAAAKAAGAKFVDLSEGGYVSKNKHDDEVSALNRQIDTLNGTITQRDTDLEAVKKQLEEAGTDAEKLGTLTADLSNLQGRYDNDIKAYKDQLKKQAYEFAVKEFAGTKKFTSQAAKRDFINSMIAKDLKMDKDKILGADDFVTAYSTDNADAFVVEKQPEPEPKPQPTFVNPTPGGTPTPDPTGGFKFNFTGVRPHE